MVVSKIKIMLLGLIVLGSANAHVFANVSPNQDFSDMYGKLREAYSASAVPQTSDLEGTWGCVSFFFDTSHTYPQTTTTFRSHGNRFVERLSTYPNSSIVQKYGFILNSSRMRRIDSDNALTIPVVANGRFHSATGNLIFEFSAEGTDTQYPPAIDQPELVAYGYEACRKQVDSGEK